jgi:hypothetical protein
MPWSSAMTCWATTWLPPGVRWMPSGERVLTMPGRVGDERRVAALGGPQRLPGVDEVRRRRRHRDLMRVDDVDVHHLAAEVGVLHGWHAHPDDGGAATPCDLQELCHPLSVEGVPLRRVVGHVGRPEEVLGVIRPDHDDDDLRIDRLEVVLQLGWPVEVVRPGQPRALARIERRVDHTGGGEVRLQRATHVQPDGVADDEDTQGVGCRRELGVRRRGRGRRGSGQRLRVRPRLVVRPLPTRRRPRERQPRAPRLAVLAPRRRDDPGELQRATDRGHRAHQVEAHGAALADGRHLGVVLESGGEEQEPHTEGAEPQQEHAGPRRSHPPVGRCGRRSGLAGRRAEFPGDR